jgi:hypothetical protein
MFRKLLALFVFCAIGNVAAAPLHERSRSIVDPSMNKTTSYTHNTSTIVANPLMERDILPAVPVLEGHPKDPEHPWKGFKAMNPAPRLMEDAHIGLWHDWSIFIPIKNHGNEGGCGQRIKEVLKGRCGSPTWFKCDILDKYGFVINRPNMHNGMISTEADAAGVKICVRTTIFCRAKDMEKRFRQASRGTASPKATKFDNTDNKPGVPYNCSFEI